MALTINTNIASLTAQRNLTDSQNQLSTSLSRLSSGLRINSAKDDAAGLAISERFTSQIKGLDQSVRNANDAISLAQTAEGALGEVTNNLQRIRELAVQSANATNSASDRATLQAEVNQLVAEIDRVSTATNFNGIKLLDGTFAAQSFQVGANAGETVTLAAITNAKSSSLGTNQVNVGSGTGVYNNVGAAADAALTDNTAAGASFTITSNGVTTSSITTSGNFSATETAAAINTATDAGASGVTATATNTAYLGNFGSFGAGDVMAFQISTGGSGGYSSATITETISDTADLSAVVNSINSSSLGVTASQVTLTTGVAIKLESTDGRDIAINDFGFDASSSAATVANASDITTASLGLDTSFTNSTLITANGNAGEANNDSAVAVGQVQLNSTGGISIGTNADFDNLTSTKTALSALSISTASGANTALSIVDSALKTINSARGDLGAYQNRFESVVSNLQVTSENLSASRSRILDADFAAETAALTKAQIIQQSGIAMLAQANAIPQNVLALLQ